MFSTTDTIVAIATPPGRGGIGVVRIAGPEACHIGQTLLQRRAPLRARHATFGRVQEFHAGTRQGAVDQVVATWFEAPHSYTGDHVVELSAHGSDVLLRRIVELAVSAGARLAEPGEFTLRAYLNGRLDLVQAEAVADLVEAVTPLQARAALDQLEGTLTRAISRIEASLFDLTARLEASLDFPEEGFHFVTREQAVADLTALGASLEALIAEGRAGRVVREGRLVVITGRPNAGKSSLFNALVGAARAIVTDVPGTTRDLVTERVDIGGVPVTLVDTAGLRDARDAIEREGVKRAEEARTVAALTIAVVDGSEPYDADTLPSALVSRENIVVISKADRVSAWPRETLGGLSTPAVSVSAVTGAGLDVLRRRIVSALTEREEWRDPPAVSNMRHLNHLEDARATLANTEAMLVAGVTEELVLGELAAARLALEQVSGRRAPEELLHHIFSRFCVGK